MIIVRICGRYRTNINMLCDMLTYIGTDFSKFNEKQNTYEYCSEVGRYILIGSYFLFFSFPFEVWVLCAIALKRDLPYSINFSYWLIFQMFPLVLLNRNRTMTFLLPSNMRTTSKSMNSRFKSKRKKVYLNTDKTEKCIAIFTFVVGMWSFYLVIAMLDVVI